MAKQHSDGFNLKVCEIKHETIDENIKEIKKDIEQIKGNENKQYEEIKDMITGLTMEVKSSHTNLKNKIVLTEKTVGEKIDSLNDFDESLKGNGKPGIWENIRSIKRSEKWIFALILILILLTLGGNYRGVSTESIKEKIFGPDQQKTKQVDDVPLYLIPSKNKGF